MDNSCKSICPSIDPFVYPYVCLSACLSFRLFVCLSVRLSAEMEFCASAASLLAEDIWQIAEGFVEVLRNICRLN